VESTSRRTGLQLGLAAVTEPNTGDIAVKLKRQAQPRGRRHHREIRAKVKTQEPALDVDFTQVLQDMIGDLTGAPQPVVVKLFSPDAGLLAAWAPRVADALGKIDVNGTSSRWSI
jgi:Cu/Ag efflux pump CusA